MLFEAMQASQKSFCPPLSDLVRILQAFAKITA